MVNDFEVIHMGGRTYNPILGRFMQADPFVQAPSNLQNYNRYSYVLNNPMSYTDPSGYFFKPLKKIGRNVIRGAVKVFGAQVVSMAGNIASLFCGPAAPACAAAWNYEFSRAMGASSTGALKAAFIAGATTYAFQQIGKHFSVSGADNVDAVVFGGAQYGNYLDFGGNLLTAGQAAAQITAHAMVGGIAASVQGGKFGHGFFSAGVTKGAGGAWLPGGGKLSGGQVAYGAVVSAVIGGTASVIAGGKFENGAKTAVFQYLYNQSGPSIKRVWSGILEIGRGIRDIGQGIIEGGSSVFRGVYRFGYQATREFDSDINVQLSTELESMVMYEAGKLFYSNDAVRSQLRSAVVDFATSSPRNFGYVLGRFGVGVFTGVGLPAFFGDAMHHTQHGISTKPEDLLYKSILGK